MISQSHGQGESQPVHRLSLGDDDNYIMTHTQKNPSKKKDKGLEFDPSVHSDWELCKKIFENHEYNLHADHTKIDQNIQKTLESLGKKDKASLASLIGIQFLGMMGFAQLSYGMDDKKGTKGFKGMGVGYRASRNLAKKAKSSKLTNEDVYTIKLSCLLEMGAIQEKELKFNMNKYRVMLEKILTEFAPAFDTSVYSDPHTIEKLLVKLHKFLLKVENQKTILLSYKLFKTYLKVTDEADEEKRKETAHMIYAVFLPFMEAMEYKMKNLKKIENLISYSKIKKFVLGQEIQALLKKYPDPHRNPSALSLRTETMKKAVNFNERIGKIMNWGVEEAQDFLNQSSFLNLTESDSPDLTPKADSMPIMTRKLSKYDSDIDEKTPSDRGTDPKVLATYEFTHNSNHDLIHSDSPNRGLSRDHGHAMHDGVHHSSKVNFHAVSNDFPDDDEYILNDPYLYRGERPKTKTLVPIQKPIISTSIRTTSTTNTEETKEPDEIDTKTEITFQKLLSIAADNVSKWEILKNDDHMKVCKIKPENSPVVMIRAWCHLDNTTTEQVYKCIYDTKVRSKWDTVISNVTSLERIDEYNDYFYFMVKAPIGVSNRDFVQKRCFRKNYPSTGHTIISFQSTTYEKVPPIHGTVRADTHIAGYLIQPVNDGRDCELTIISQVDIKGSIPKALVNMFAGKAPAEWMGKLKKACHEQI